MIDVAAEIANEQMLSSLSTRPLKEIHKTAIALRFQGKKYQEIADILKLKEHTIRVWFMTKGILFNDYASYCKQMALGPKFPTAIHSHTLSVYEKLKEYAPQAVNNIISLADSATREQVKLQANADLLDRAGYKPVERIVNLNMVEEMGLKDLNILVDGILGKHGVNLVNTATNDDEQSVHENTTSSVIEPIIPLSNEQGLDT